MDKKVFHIATRDLKYKPERELLSTSLTLANLTKPDPCQLDHLQT